MAASRCPAEDRLRLLLAGAGSDPGDHAELVKHLDECSACQHRLERLADTTLNLLGVARRVGESSDTAGEESLRRLLVGLGGEGEHKTNTPLPLGLRDGYVITGLLGQGAMGQVLAAFDPALQRAVAVKVLAPNLAGDQLARERFAREARAAAAVKHRNVVTIHAVGELDGLPYLVMEYIPGGTVQEYLTHHGPPDWDQVARLGAEIAEGLAAAHAAGLVHRDIKPSNILLESSAPGEPGTAKLADFGLARITDESRLTESGVLAGTPMYMAPEQALGELLDERADLFSLGSLLYTLCTGREPFSGGNPLAVLRQVCEATPIPVRQLNPHVPGWLAEVINRLHTKRPQERPASAAEIATLLRHNLANPDRPRFLPGRIRFGRARRRIALLLTVAGVLLAGLLIVLNLVSEHDQPIPHGLKLRRTLRGHTGPVWAASFSPDARILVTGSDDTTLRFWDARAGKELGKIAGTRGAVYSVVFAADGKKVIAGRGDGTLEIYDTQTRKATGTLPHSGGNPRRLAVSPNGQTVAAGSTRQGVELWDLATLRLLRELPGQPTTLLALAFAPDGKVLATGNASGEIHLWDAEKGTERDFFIGDPLGLRSLAFSPDNETLASAGTGERAVKLWQYTSRRLLETLVGFDDVVLKLDFSPDGARLATGGRDGSIKIWDVSGGKLLGTAAAHKGSVWAVDFSSDGTTLVSVGEDRLVKLWEVPARTDQH